jgi:hypothetical protein
MINPPKILKPFKAQIFAAKKAVQPFLERSGVLRRLTESENELAQWAGGMFGWQDADYALRQGKPWWNFKTQRRIAEFLHGGEKEVFEYGAGSSTKWLAGHAKSVISVEHDPQWFRRIQPMLAEHANVELLHVPPTPLAAGETSTYTSRTKNYDGFHFEDYVKTIERDQRKYDLVIIDGRARPQCLAHAADRVKPGGLILLDDAHRQTRPHYVEAIENNPRLKVEYIDGLKAVSFSRTEGRGALITVQPPVINAPPLTDQHIYAGKSWQASVQPTSPGSNKIVR